MIIQNFNIKNLYKKFNLKKKIDFNKKNKNTNVFLSFYYTILSSSLLILFFYLLPSFSNFIDKNFHKSQIVLNSSKSDFNKVLEGKELKKNTEENDELNAKNLYDDIIDIEDVHVGTISDIIFEKANGMLAYVRITLTDQRVLIVPYEAIDVQTPGEE